MQSALEGLGDIGAGEVRVTGGPLPAAPIDVEFTGRFAGTHAALLTAVDNTNAGAGAGLRVTQTQSLAVSIRDAINSLVPPASSIAALTPSATAVKLTGVSRVDVSLAPGLMTGVNVVRVAGNAGTDNDADTAGDNRPYLVGTSNSNAVLPDGDGLIVPQGVTLMVDEGALLKLRKANIDAGTSAVAVNRGGGAVQVLGTPDRPVLFRSYRDDTVGGNDGPDGRRGEARRLGRDRAPRRFRLRAARDLSELDQSRRSGRRRRQGARGLGGKLVCADPPD